MRLEQHLWGTDAVTPSVLSGPDWRPLWRCRYAIYKYNAFFPLLYIFLTRYCIFTRVLLLTT